jgi:hypothetical protein
MGIQNLIKSAFGITALSLILAGCDEPGNMAKEYGVSSSQGSSISTNIVSLKGVVKAVQPQIISVGTGGECSYRFAHQINMIYFVADDSSEHVIIEPYSVMHVPGRRENLSFYKIIDGSTSVGEFRRKFIVKGSSYEDSLLDGFLIKADGIIVPRGTQKSGGLD